MQANVFTNTIRRHSSQLDISDLQRTNTLNMFLNPSQEPNPKHTINLRSKTGLSGEISGCQAPDSIRYISKNDTETNLEKSCRVSHQSKMGETWDRLEEEIIEQSEDEETDSGSDDISKSYFGSMTKQSDVRSRKRSRNESQILENKKNLNLIKKGMAKRKNGNTRREKVQTKEEENNFLDVEAKQGNAKRNNSRLNWSGTHTPKGHILVVSACHFSKFSSFM